MQAQLLASDAVGNTFKYGWESRRLQPHKTHSQFAEAWIAFGQTIKRPQTDTKSQQYFQLSRDTAPCIGRHSLGTCLDLQTRRAAPTRLPDLNQEWNVIQRKNSRIGFAVSDINHIYRPAPQCQRCQIKPEWCKRRKRESKCPHLKP